MESEVRPTDDQVREHRRRLLLAIQNAVISRHGRRLASGEWRERVGVTREHLGKVLRGQRPGLSVKAVTWLGRSLVDLDLEAKDCLCFLKASPEYDKHSAHILDSLATYAERVATSGEAHVEFAVVSEGVEERVSHRIPFTKGGQTVRLSLGSQVLTVTAMTTY